ncbi:HWE histidine kinase domain-containing protein [Methylobacterium radiodurans]|uniref:HWE histidine kinase domain-containing protein n=1 Tax=Methylobacterium radiodurans TaxID=2202828 RepID=UPI001FEC8641|nr:HWE histidine kinase domain-containing protein [Methylobacterium radiodurans]
MVAELQHRTRNLIAVVTGIAQETLAQTGPGAAFAAQFEDRLAALSRVQGLLSRSAEAPITIEALVRMELRALAIHELATNARKYGALATARGALAVGWHIRIDAAEGADDGRRWLVMDWVETEPDPVRAEAGRAGRRGYGRELIEEALPFALGARTRYELDLRGVRCRIELPLDRRAVEEVCP